MCSVVIPATESGLEPAGVLTLASDVDVMRVLTYLHLRRIGLLMDRRMLDPNAHPFVGMILCRDGRTFMDETHSDRTVEGISIIPFPMFGGVIRWSRHCPEMPDSVFGFKTSPNTIHTQSTTEAIRIGMALFKNRLLKGCIHENWVQNELGCGWGLRLKLGLFQMVRLGADGRAEIKHESVFRSWVSEGEFEVLAPLKLMLIVNGKRVNVTTIIDPHHPLIERYNVAITLTVFDDRRFLEVEAHDLLREYEADPRPETIERLWMKYANHDLGLAS